MWGISAIATSVRIIKLLFAYSQMGVLIVAIGAMVQEVGTALSVFVAITIGIAQCQQVVLADYPVNYTDPRLHHPVGLMEDRDAEHFSPWAAPFFSIFGYVKETSFSTDFEAASSTVAPLILWLYMLLVQVLMLNLIIAIMTDTYFRVARGEAEAEWRMSRVKINQEFILRHHVPAPFSLLSNSIYVAHGIFGIARRCGIRLFSFLTSRVTQQLDEFGWRSSQEESSSCSGSFDARATRWDPKAAGSSGKHEARGMTLVRVSSAEPSSNNFRRRSSGDAAAGAWSRLKERSALNKAFGKSGRELIAAGNSNRRGSLGAGREAMMENAVRYLCAPSRSRSAKTPSARKSPSARALERRPQSFTETEQEPEESIREVQEQKDVEIVEEQQARAEYDRSRKANFEQRDNAHIVQLGLKLDDLLKARASERKLLLEVQMAHERDRALLLDLQSKLAADSRYRAGSDPADEPSPGTPRRSSCPAAPPVRSSSDVKCDV